MYITHHRWPLDDLDATNQVGIDVVAVADAVVAPPYGQRLLATVDADRHPSRPLDAADVEVQRAAVAGVAAEHTDQVLDHIGRVGTAIALHPVAAGIGRAQVEREHVVVSPTITCFAAVGLQAPAHFQRVGDHHSAVSGGGLQGPGAARLLLRAQATALQQLVQCFGGAVLALHCTRAPPFHQIAAEHHLHLRLAAEAAHCVGQGLFGNGIRAHGRSSGLGAGGRRPSEGNQCRGDGQGEDGGAAMTGGCRERHER
ncbi:hypothetical protein D3C72_1108200 [compost metagenome]